jgi:hypothetical protein
VTSATRPRSEKGGGISWDIAGRFLRAPRSRVEAKFRAAPALSRDDAVKIGWRVRYPEARTCIAAAQSAINPPTSSV